MRDIRRVHPAAHVDAPTAQADFRVLDRCRICGGVDLDDVLSLGETPLANALVPPSSDAEERRYPLEVIRCVSCGLVQLSIVVRSELMFRDYRYMSSASPPLHRHFEGLAEEIVSQFAPPGSLVVELGSNDGALLRPLAARGAIPLGVEPASNLAAMTSAAGLETWNEFFGSSVARRIRERRGAARAVVGTNVLAHIDDVRDVVAAVEHVLDADGVFVAEVPYIVDLLEQVEYDTVYHEHLSYFAIGPLRRLMSDAGLELFDVVRLAVHGGSIRLFAGRQGRRPASTRLRHAIRAEEAAALRDRATYDAFAARVRRSRDALCDSIATIRGRGMRIAALGATAKGNTLLNYCGLRAQDIEFIADATPLKQGMLAPGSRIPIRAEEALLAERPERTLLLAWNYADAILERFKAYTAGGGRFIHPIPLAREIPA